MEGEKPLSRHSKGVFKLAIEKMIGGEDELSPMHAVWKHVSLLFCLEIEDKAASKGNSEKVVVVVFIRDFESKFSIFDYCTYNFKEN